MVLNGRRSSLTAAVVLSAALAVNQASAQVFARPKGPGEIHFETNVGSFKLMSINNEEVSGTLTFSFHGTVLLSGYTQKPKVTGNVRLEYQNDKYKKLGYHGVGTFTVTGPLHSVEWFGTLMKGQFIGRGKMRFVGEFDKNLNTGTYYYTDPKDVKYWPANNVTDQPVPPYGMPGSNNSAGNEPISRQEYDKLHKKAGK